MYKEGQRILERQRFAFPPSWLYVDNIEGEWGAFNDILKRKDSSIQTQVIKKQHVPLYFSVVHKANKLKSFVGFTQQFKAQTYM